MSTKTRQHDKSTMDTPQTESLERDWQALATEYLGELGADKGTPVRLVNIFVSGWDGGSSVNPDYLTERLYLSDVDAEKVIRGFLEVLRPFADQRVGDDG